MISMTLTQHTLQDWPLGIEKDAAYLQLLPSQIGSRVPIAFEPGRDQLGLLEGAVLSTPLTGPFAIIHHRDAPMAGTKIVIDREATLDDLATILAVLKISSGDLAWINPDLSASRTGRALRRSGRRFKLGVGTRLTFKQRVEQRARRTAPYRPEGIGARYGRS